MTSTVEETQEVRQVNIPLYDEQTMTDLREHFKNVSDRDLLLMIVAWQARANVLFAELRQQADTLMENPMLKSMMEIMG